MKCHQTVDEAQQNILIGFFPWD